jgi:hypothetical protein
VILTFFLPSLDYHESDTSQVCSTLGHWSILGLEGLIFTNILAYRVQKLNVVNKAHALVNIADSQFTENR